MRRAEFTLISGYIRHIFAADDAFFVYPYIRPHTFQYVQKRGSRGIYVYVVAYDLAEQQTESKVVHRESKISADENLATV